MSVESSIIANVLIIKISSELLNEIDNNEFEEFLSENLEHGITEIVVDITGVNYFNSSHIGLIVRLFSVASNKDAVLKIGGSGERISSLLQSVKLDTIISVHSTVTEAIDSFQ